MSELEWRVQERRSRSAPSAHWCRSTRLAAGDSSTTPNKGGICLGWTRRARGAHCSHADGEHGRGPGPPGQGHRHREHVQLDCSTSAIRGRCPSERKAWPPPRHPERV